MPAQPVKERLVKDGESVVVERDPQEGGSLIERQQAAKQDEQPVEAAQPEELEEDHTRDELYERAQELDVKGRSSMDKDELAAAVAEAERAEAKAEAQALKKQRTATTSEKDAKPAEEIGPEDDVEGEGDEE